MYLLGNDYKFSINKNGEVVITHITQNIYKEQHNIYLGKDGHPSSILGTTKDVILVNHFTTKNKEWENILYKNVLLNEPYSKENLNEFKKYIKENHELNYLYKNIKINERNYDTWMLGKFCNEVLLQPSNGQYVSQIPISVPKADFNKYFWPTNKPFLSTLTQYDLIYVEDFNKNKKEIEVFQIKYGNYNNILCKDIEFINNSKNIDYEKEKSYVFFEKDKINKNKDAIESFKEIYNDKKISENQLLSEIDNYNLSQNDNLNIE